MADYGDSGTNAGGIAPRADQLDREHHARVACVAECDTAAAREAAAEVELARLEEEEQELLAQRDRLGPDEHVDGIRRSGWYPYADSIRRAAKLFWALDLTLWLGLLGSLAVVAWRAFNA
jgi:hypothetical protein